MAGIHKLSFLYLSFFKTLKKTKQDLRFREVYLNCMHMNKEVPRGQNDGGNSHILFEIKCGCVSEVLDSNVPALTEKEELVKDVKVRGNLGCHDHEIVKIRILSGAPCKKQGCNSCLQKKNPRVKWFAQRGCRVCILEDVQN